LIGPDPCRAAVLIDDVGGPARACTHTVARR
jgi:hypothetical protein